MNRDREDFYKKLADFYAEEKGEEYKKLSNELNKNDYDFPKSLDKKINKLVNKNRFRKIYSVLGWVASIVLIFSLGIIDRQKKNNYVPPGLWNEEDDIKFMSANIPEGFEIINVNYDVGEKIFRIVDNTKDEFVMSVKNNIDNFIIDDLSFIKLVDTNIYIKDYEEYKLATFVINNEQYTITTLNELDKTLEISESILKNI